VIAGPPNPNLPDESARRRLPPIVAELAAGDDVRPVWLNELGGITCELAGASGRRFVKWAPPGVWLDLPAEAERLAWAAPFTPVPRVLGQGADETGTWLLTAAVPGESAVSPRWTADPATAVEALGRGLRALHDALPVEDCPFSWSVEDRVAASLAAKPERRDATVSLLDHPPIDSLVVCHGDACAPNTLLDDDGAWSAHVDLGDLGVADRWADLAVATWSTEWNYGPGWGPALLAAYGVDDDPERTDYYRRLWDAGP
jgi:kanamycin kinase